MKQPKQLWFEAAEIIGLNVLLTIKLLIFNAINGFTSGMLFPLTATLPLFIVITAWFSAFSRKMKYTLYVIFNLLITFVLVADSLFYSFFHTIIPLPILSQIGQVGGVKSSVGSALSPALGLLLIDLIPLAVYLIVRKKKAEQSTMTFKSRLAVSFAVAFIGVIAVTGQFAVVRASAGSEAFSNLYENNTVLKKLGVFNYHVVDAYNVKIRNASAEMPVSDFKTWMEVHRQSGTELNGAVQGKNLIMIQMEALQQAFVNRSVDGQEITPNLNRFIERSRYFDNISSPIGQGNTVDAEFMTMNSMYPLPAGAVYNLKNQNHFHSLPTILKEQGYTTAAFHGYVPTYYQRDKMYVSEGFDSFTSASDYTLDESIGLGLSDESFYKQTMPKLIELNKSGKPFLSFLVTLSGHHPYQIPENKQSMKIPASYSKTLGDYIQAQHYADQALGEFLQQLENEGIMDKSLVVIYGDHFAPGVQLSDLKTFLGLDHDLSIYESAELMKVPLVMHFPGDENAGTDHVHGSQMDTFPTLLNLFGVDKSNLFYFGQDLINPNDHMTIYRYYLPSGSFGTQDYFYVASDDGVFDHGHAFDRKSGKEVALSKVAASHKQARWQLQVSDSILNQDGLPSLMKK
ncbi:hypothetical protein SD71_01215 [Cohnella kolymensis]|uniref:Sulfatase N-terminal domain-containing protein n=1 Tax=Cohnella kolymensis TaxID=1590652 RepID=A0ABR5A8G7_9BACL|nr:LTA synthase family protein [Cohnella kolymensis]KIL37335.1 hypothetical protein SD71_01215 [Cohnella kolymensis]